MLRGEVLDPRFLVWGCIIGFLAGWIAWERICYRGDRDDIRQRSE